MATHRVHVPRLILSVLLPAAAALWQWRLHGVLGAETWLLFVAAVLAAYWVGGQACGLAATVLATALGWWQLPPAQTLAKSPAAWASTAAFLVVAALIGAFHRAYRRANQQLLQGQIQYARLFELAPDAAFIAGLDGQCLDVNAAWCTLLDRGPAGIIGHDLAEVIGGEDLGQLQQMLTLLRRDGRSQGELHFRHHNGAAVACEVSASILPDGTWLGMIRDIGERRRLESQLKHSADHDALTGLPNRLRFEAVLRSAVERAQWRNGLMALLYVDLDKFKAVNDTLGHAAGDRLLQEVADRLVHCVRTGDTVARLSGDEFTIVLEAISRAEDGATVAAKVVEALHRPFLLEGRELCVSASVGISVYPDHASTAQELRHHADTALYAAKDGGRDGFRMYSTTGAAEVADAAAAPPAAVPARPRAASSALGLTATAVSARASPAPQPARNPPASPTR